MCPTSSQTTTTTTMPPPPPFPLPVHLVRMIYQYDTTYRHAFNVCLLELMLLFHRYEQVRRVFRRLRRDRLVFQLYSAGGVNVIMGLRV